jgi:PPM family protein phosphatase
MPFRTEFVSRVGGRAENQDACDFVEASGTGCWVVADGLGGHRGGEIASRSAVEAVLTSFGKNPQLSEEALQRHLKAAEGAVIDAQTQQPDLSTMRTTIVVLLADLKRALWAHMGDSRLYYFQNGQLTFQTSDHSVVQVMADSGQLPREQIRHHEDRNRLLRCLGNPESDFRPTILSEPRALGANSAFLLCSDGFWENVLESEMVVDLAKSKTPAEWLTLMEDRLLERANDGNDNYTGLAIVSDEGIAP